MLTLEELRADVETGAVDTVIAAFTDMQGRLMGKRLDAEFFLSELEGGHGSEGCNYLLALEMEMDPVPGYAIASWERGYGDFGLIPDIATLRRVPWHEATVMVQCDVEWHDGTPVAPSPRQVLRAQVEKARALGYEPMFGSELEFFLFRESYAEAHAKHYHDLTPSVPYILDYHILASSYDEPFLREVRTSMKTAGMRVESSKGEAWAGQHEINFRYADALKAADDHVVYKTGIKEIAYQRGCSVTFMAKPDHTWVGSSCHIHSSLWQDGKAAFAGESDVFKHYLAGQIACASELAIFYAPTINSYKRFAAGSWAPTTLAWGYDNRTCGFRVVGKGSALRAETRIPGADANPYLAFAALLAAGLYGIEQKLELGPPLEGNAYTSDAAALPARAARRRRRARAGHARTEAARRRGDRPLPQLRAHGAGALRQGRHGLRAGEDVRARVKPVVGITTYVEPARWGAWELEAALIPYAYVQAVERAGGRALLVPPSEDAVEETLDALDGLLFSGGNDLDPETYGAAAHPETGGLRPERDRGELALLEAALARDMPVLAVCRGFQVLNVARGGDLVQHLPEVVGDAKHREVAGVFSEHAVRIEDDSKLGGVLGESAPVKSHHHQGVGTVGQGLREVAWADDGTVEGLEDPDRRFAVGVLWHPEAGDDMKLFEALVAEASAYRKEHR